MATFSTKKMIYADSSLIREMGERISKSFEAEGYEVLSTPLSSGGWDISITKGNMFKAVLGMKTALKVSLTPRNGSIFFDAGVGIFGQQAIPTIISMLFLWPIIITQIWGMVEQSKLDDKALEIAESVMAENRTTNYSSSYSSTSDKKVFCTNCGKEIPGGSKFCPECGGKV